MILALAVAFFLYAGDKNSFGFIHIFGLSMLFLMVFNLVGRKFKILKPYYVSKLNPLSIKHKLTRDIDLPKELLVPKIVEALKVSKYNVEDVDIVKGEVFAMSSVGWNSWGQNVYIDIEEINGISRMHFCSVEVHMAVDWGKNKKTYNTFIENFEASLVI